MNLRDSARHLRAILCSVDYAGELSLALAANMRHWKECWVVTSHSDRATQDVALQHGARLHITDAFYRDCPNGFRKWLGVEEALDAMGRHGWLLVGDADVIWPAVLPDFTLEVGKLYTPLRRMAPLTQTVPSEERWGDYPLHRNLAEWASYAHLFHASDPHLPAPPWYETDWIHAGGADSYFQARWPAACKARPPFEVLHMGPAGTNWLGRASRRLDGTIPEDAAERQYMLRGMIHQRVPGPLRHRHEKI